MTAFVHITRSDQFSTSWHAVYEAKCWWLFESLLQLIGTQSP